MYIRHFVILFTIFSLLFSSSIAHANIGKDIQWYIGAKLGYNGIISQDITTYSSQAITPSPYTDFLSGLKLGGTAGLEFSIIPKLKFRTELEYMYSLDVNSEKKVNNNKFTLSSTAHNLLINTYLDYTIIKFVAVYVSFGLGTSILEVEGKEEIGTTVEKVDNVQTNFAWQLGIGTRLEVTENIIADLNIRYLDLGAIKSFGNDRLKMKNKSTGSFEVLVSVGYLF